MFSLEMSKESLLTRMVCAAARVDQQRFRAGYLNQEERQALQDALFSIVESPLYLDDTAGTNLMDVHSKLRRLQAEQDLGLVIVDYLQLMQGRGRVENRVQEISSSVARLQVDVEGAAGAVSGAFAVEPRTGDAARRSSADAERSAGIGKY